MNTSDRDILSVSYFSRFTCIAIIIGHIDLLYRIFSPPMLSNFYWQELYQALFIPIALFAIVSVPFEILSRLLGGKNDSSHSSGFLKLLYWLYSYSVLFVLVTLYVLIVSLGQESLYSKSGSIILIITVIACLILAPLASKLLKPADVILRHQGYKNYSFFVIVFSCSMLLYDLFDSAFVSNAENLLVDKSTAIAARPGAATQPHVLLITLDTMRADMFAEYLDSAGAHPYLKEVAENSAVFKRAMSTTSWTLPAHASLFTGLPVHIHKATGRHQMLSRKHTTLAESLLGQNYSTAGIIGGPFCSSKYGLAQGFEYYSDRLDFFLDRHTKNALSFIRFLRFFSKGVTLPILHIDGERTAEELNAEALELIDSRITANNPLFLFLNYFDVHDPYTLQLAGNVQSSKERRSADRLNRSVLSLYNHHAKRYRQNTLPEKDVALLKKLYRDEIAYLGHHLGEFLEQVHIRLGKDSVITVITADHGEEFLEHGGVLHAQTLYNEVLHVPLIVHWPKSVSSEELWKITSIVDIKSFLLKMINLGIDPRLTALFKTAAGREQIYASRYARPEYGEVELHAMVEDEMKVIVADPEKERIPNALYGLKSDWNEQQNLNEQNKELFYNMVEELSKEITHPKSRDKAKASSLSGKGSVPSQFKSVAKSL